MDKWKKQLEEKLKNPEFLKAGKEELLKGLLSFGIGFFFAQGSFLFGSYPFGISLLAPLGNLGRMLSRLLFCPGISALSLYFPVHTDPDPASHRFS